MFNNLCRYKSELTTPRIPTRMKDTETFVGVLKCFTGRKCFFENTVSSSASYRDSGVGLVQFNADPVAMQVQIP